MDITSKSLSDDGNKAMVEINTSQVCRNTHSEGSRRAMDSICAISCGDSIDGATINVNRADVKPVIGQLCAVGGTSISQRLPGLYSGLDDTDHVKGQSDPNAQLNFPGNAIDIKVPTNGTFDLGFTNKKSLEFCFSDYKPGTRNRNPQVSNDSGTVKVMGYGRCISAFYTVVWMSCMLVALLAPALFHVCCQFRLYGGFIPTHDRNVDSDDIKLRGSYIISDARSIVNQLSEFENFFLIGVFLYLLIQIIGFYVTQARIRMYLWRLCEVSVEMAKHDFLYDCKQRAVEHFSDYTKSISRNQTHVCTQTERRLVKAFDEAASNFGNNETGNIWRKTSLMRYRILLTRVYIPIIINLLISIGTSVFVYDRRLRMHHRVPLAHPDIVANFYWYAAIQYEGFWCIFTLMVLNFTTWVYLCYVNLHKTLFGLLEEAHNQIRTVAADYSSKLAKDIWDNQMLLFSSTVCAMDTNKVGRSVTCAPLRVETFNSQINFNTDVANKGGRQCLCRFLCMPSTERGVGIASPFVGGTPFEELHTPLMESGLHRHY
ncbi:hypothetical protein, conserved [Babesia bigemina]|uniref:Uncharacterized protein n=1 Tax=Babesia bigemina TaxID=5866 RepID=A0A061D484_BABBI|nr:hypothetical protein, conserved [Babesia bigemina]CDR95383.1 hypothetical protein, conserved [Babesia bigemina]|eukprot:XP_012767569.1 hypothetical protein, conserved [Babesia bigemina]